MSTGMIWQTHATGSAATERLGELLGKHLTAPEVVELQGDLGGGKTTFARGLIGGLGYSGVVSSPSFTLNRIYNLSKDKRVYHYDFYRLTEPGILADQLAEALSDEQGITVVEWSDIVAGVLPDERITVLLEPKKADPDGRIVTFKYPVSKTAVIRQLESDWVEVEP